MIDPTTLDFNTFHGVNTTSAEVVYRPNVLPTVLIVFGLSAIAVGIILYVEKYYSIETNE